MGWLTNVVIDWAVVGEGGILPTSLGLAILNARAAP